MADFTKAAGGQLMDWTLLDDTGGVPSLETAALDSGESLDVALEALLFIDMAHADANDAATNYAYAVIWIKSGTTDDDWHEFLRLQATGGTANVQILNAASGPAQANDDRIEVAATANFDTPGDVYFLHDLGTLADSAIAVNLDVVTNDYVQAVDNLVNDYDTADYLRDIVDQWSIILPASIEAARVTFHNTDADATYACRVRHKVITAIG